MKNLESKSLNIPKRITKLCAAITLGLFVYETASETFNDLNHLDYTLYMLRENGDYFSYAKELFKPGFFLLIEGLLGIKSIEYGLEAFKKEENKK